MSPRAKAWFLVLTPIVVSLTVGASNVFLAAVQAPLSAYIATLATFAVPPLVMAGQSLQRIAEALEAERVVTITHPEGK